MYSGKKGQFFLVGALAICMLLFFGLTPAVRLVSTSSAGIENIAKNLEMEIPHAASVGVNASNAAGVLTNFTVYALSAASDSGAELDCLWVLFEPMAGSMNVTAGNFMDSPVTLEINISGTYKTLYANAGTQNSTTFSTPDYTFLLEMEVDGKTFSADILTNKTSVYSLISVSSGDNSARKEILA